MHEVCAKSVVVYFDAMYGVRLVRVSYAEYFQGLNDTANPPNLLCPIEEVCGFGGFEGNDPNQWFR